ncbi:branched-chain amino acid transport ATP-binding protein LivG [Desulfocucumis palustris]|uniref:Branched-chain amino acid transport ATP-binding protein LivG n=1 Tax=Desulfocucumis palustris TaxID=1898651 RepID=A0A2L2XF06_9FIRM|nr:ABC transporter ATP-binding protein [Desulfocucumis palustris]GBF32411.1 branched-chain amino acid transport ATP-binding protein LivG [Desulfocucumis palustris]
MKVLDIQNVTIRFGGLEAIRDVSFSADEGQLLAIIGPNGAGKTTIFNAMTGVYQPTVGQILFNGKLINGLKPNQLVTMGVARTFQNIRLFSALTVLENVMVGSQCRSREGLWGALAGGKKVAANRVKSIQQCREFIEIVGLTDYLDELATNLPYGKQRLLEIARALATGCELLLLDEPAAGMNAVEREELVALIRRISKELNKTIILIEHDINLVMNISEHIVVLDHGEKIAEGTPGEIRTNQKVIEAYLGSEDPLEQEVV